MLPTHWLMAAPHHAEPATAPPTPGDVTSPPKGVMGLAKVTHLAPVTVCRGPGTRDPVTAFLASSSPRS